MGLLKIVIWYEKQKKWNRTRSTETKPNINQKCDKWKYQTKKIRGNANGKNGKKKQNKKYGRNAIKKNTTHINYAEMR